MRRRGKGWDLWLLNEWCGGTKEMEDSNMRGSCHGFAAGLGIAKAISAAGIHRVAEERA